MAAAGCSRWVAAVGIPAAVTSVAGAVGSTVEATAAAAASAAVAAAAAAAEATGASAEMDRAARGKTGAPALHPTTLSTVHALAVTSRDFPLHRARD